MTIRTAAVPLLVIAVLVPAVMLLSGHDAGLPSGDKTVTTVSLDEDALDFTTLTKGSELVIKGNVLGSYVFTKQAYDGQAFPDIYTKYEIKVANVLKGETDQDTITIVTRGGEISDRISVTEAVQIKETDDVILFLEKSGAHYTGAGNYNPIAPVQGVFLLEEDIAKSGAFGDTSESDLMHAIEAAQQE